MSVASHKKHICALVCAAAVSAGPGQGAAVAGERSVLARIIADASDSAGSAPIGPVLTGQPSRSVVWRVAQGEPQSGELETNLELGHQEPAEPPSAAGPVDQTLAPASRNFRAWQQRADEKLKLEGSPGRAEHPLANDNPDDFIVVCEAGCTAGVDSIVSRVAKPLQMQAAQRGFDPTSASGAGDEKQEPAAVSPTNAATIRCEAGCSGVAKSHKARLPRTSALSGKPSRLAGLRRYRLLPQQAKNGAIVGPRIARHFVVRRAYASSQVRIRLRRDASNQHPLPPAETWRARRAALTRPRDIAGFVD